MQPVAYTCVCVCVCARGSASTSWKSNAIIYYATQWYKSGNTVVAGCRQECVRTDRQQRTDDCKVADEARLRGHGGAAVPAVRQVGQLRHGREHAGQRRPAACHAQPELAAQRLLQRRAAQERAAPGCCHSVARRLACRHSSEHRSESPPTTDDLKPSFHNAQRKTRKNSQLISCFACSGHLGTQQGFPESACAAARCSSAR